MVKWTIIVQADGREYRWTFERARDAVKCYAEAYEHGFEVRVRQVQGREHVRVGT